VREPLFPCEEISWKMSGMLKSAIFPCKTDYLRSDMLYFT
jgi:hypothetical protein